MSVPWKQVLLDELVQRQVLQPDAQARLQFEEDAPWYVMILSAIAAWFAAMMLLGAWTIMTDASPLPSMLAAAILLLSAIWLLRGSGAFVMQLGWRCLYSDRPCWYLPLSSWDRTRVPMSEARQWRPCC